MPPILRTLREAEVIQKRNVVYYSNPNDAVQRQAILEESRELEPLMRTCQSRAKELSRIFTAAMPKDGESRSWRYVKALRSALPGKKRRVAQLHCEILEKLQILHTYHSFRPMSTAGELEAMIKHALELRDVSPVRTVSPPSPEQSGFWSARGDDGPTSEHRQQRFETRDFSTPRHRFGGSEREVPIDQNQWKNGRDHFHNADGARVMNQGYQTIYGGQQLTM